MKKVVTKRKGKFNEKDLHAEETSSHAVKYMHAAFNVQCHAKKGEEEEEEEGELKVLLFGLNVKTLQNCKESENELNYHIFFILFVVGY